MKKTIYIIFLIVLVLIVKDISGQVIQEWVRSYNGPDNNDDMSYSSVVDASGNIIVAGKSKGIGSGFDYAVIKYNNAGVQQWIQRYNGYGISDDIATAVKSDGSGNIYVTGGSIGNGSDVDYVTIKYNSSGAQQWIQIFNGAGNEKDWSNAIIIEGSGNVYVTGSSSINTFGKRDYATIKYNSSGVFQWLKTFDAYFGRDDVAKSINADNFGNVYVTGGNGATFATIKYNSSGVQQWVQNYGSILADAVAISGSGSVYVTGGGYGYGSLIKYNSFGDQLWIRSSSNTAGSTKEWGNTMAVDVMENVYITGGQWNGVNFDYTTIKYNTLGLLQWIKTYNGPGNDTDVATSISVDGLGNVFVTGRSKGNGTTYDYATIKYNSIGTEQWVKRYNGSGNGEDRASSISLDGFGNAYVSGRSWNGTNYDFATIKYSNQSQPINQPSISLSASQINPGGSVSITGQNFRVNAQVKITVISPNSQNVFEQNYTTSSAGTFSAAYPSNANSIPGTYTITAYDILTNQNAPNKIFEIKQPVEIYNLNIVSPLDTVDRTFNLEWRDKMAKSSGYVLDNTGTKRKFKFLITYSTDNGSSWENDSIITEGFETINSIPLFKKQIKLDSLINSRSGLKVMFRVTDMIKPNRYALTDSLPVRLNYLTKAKIDFIWDYSYSERDGNPIGACADGVSRFYIKVSKIPGNHTITRVVLSLNDGTSLYNYLGKLQTANDTNAFSREAQYAYSTDIDINTSKNNYWFWYVSPDDFMRPGTDDSTKMERAVRLNVTVYYSSGLPESESKNINIIRTPLMLVHGFASNHKVWDDFIGKTNIRSFFKFISTPDYNPKGSYDENAKMLMNYFQDVTNHYQSFQTIIKRARSAGYASNQVSYVCHSMGGCIARAAYKVSGYESRINYSEGYINRLITVDTPHMGSLLADFVVDTYQYIKIPPLKKILRNFQTQGFVSSSYNISEFNNYSPSEAIYHLQATGEGKYDFYNTYIQSFLIAGDLFPGSSNQFGNVDWSVFNVDALNEYSFFLDLILELTGTRLVRHFFYYPQDYGEVRDLIKNNSMNRLEKIYKLFNLFCKKNLVYLANSDFVVSVESQLAGTSRSDNNTFDRYNGNLTSLGVGHAFFNECTTDTKIANSIIDHLNLPATSENDFISFIPGTPYSSSSVLNNSQVMSPIETDNSATLNISSPENGKLCYVDSVLNVTFSVDNIDSLKYVSVSFQGEKYYDTSKTSSYNFNIMINGNDLDTCLLYINAVYISGDSIDITDGYKNLVVRSNYPVIDFEVSNDFYYMVNNETITPEYKSVFSNHIYKGVLNNISASVDNPAVINFNNSDKSFRAVSVGETFAVISLNGNADTIYFKVEGESQIPGSLQLVSPLNSSIVPAANINFNWNKAGYASYYNFQLSQDINFENIFFENNSLTDTSINISAIDDSILYYWRVKGINSAGSGNWSSVRTFYAQPLKISYYYLSIIPQGFYNENTNRLQRRDTVKIYLVNNISPFVIIDSSQALIDSVSFQGLFEFKNVPTGTYYLNINHFNSIETWSKPGGESFINSDKMYFDFTTSQSNAFGNNMIQAGTVWCIYSGDVNQDGTIDISDNQIIDNDSYNFISGYVNSDLNADGIVDISDAVISDNNSFNFVSVIKP